MVYALLIVRIIRNTEIHFQIIYKDSVRTSQETYYISATKTNRLMLFKKIIAVYCENHTEHRNTLSNNIQGFSSYLRGNILHIRYKDQPVNIV
jgi:hypothetical protein